MSYLVAKKFGKRGCYALQVEFGKHLVELKQEMNNTVRGKDIELVTISRPIAYGEYAPYTFADSEAEFCKLVKSM